MSRFRGYAGKILRVDLSSGRISKISTQDYAEIFLGGRGIAARLYWEEVLPDVGPFDPDNRLLFFTGPLAGFMGLAGSRWQVCGKSPATDTESFCYANLGGSWGAQLKFSGYDGLVIQGKANRPVYLFIQDDIVEVRDASALWGKPAIQTREALKAELGRQVRVVTTGTAGDYLVSFATLLADDDASASCGFGAVMGSKNLKAIAVRGSGSVKAAHPERLKEISGRIRKLKEGPVDPGLYGPRMKQKACYGCIRGCIRYVFEASDGTKGKYMCQSGVFYTERARRYYGEWNEVPFRANQLCDDYGLDTNAVEAMIMWLSRCYKAGILNDENTGLPLSQLGSWEFIDSFIRQISLKEGFGEVLAQGLTKAARTVGKGAEELITDFTLKAGQTSFYDGRLYVTTSLLYAMEPRQPIQQLHEVSGLVFSWLRWLNKEKDSYLSSQLFREIAWRYWGSECAADFSTYEGKAQAARKIQDRQYVKESLILCDFSWPIMHTFSTEDHLCDPALESQVYSAITGNEVDEEEMYRFGERVFNLQRAILVREGHRGRQDDGLPEPFFTIPIKTAHINTECLVPGKDGAVLSRKGTVVDRDKFEEMKTEYYGIRGWDPATGLQKKGALEELGLADVA